MTSNDFEAPFGITVKELKELMELKAQEFKQKLDNEFGGIEGLANKLKTDFKTGLTGQDINNRLKYFGKNEIPPKPPKSIFRLAFEALQDTTLIMLMICAVISIGLSFYHPPADNSDETIRLVSAEIMNLEWVEGVAIAIAVIVVVSVSSFNDWRKERQFRGLQDRIAADNMANVIRNGQNLQVNVKDLVVGDVCCIKYGDLIPADGAVIQASDLKIDEASLTGETDLIKKNEDNPVIFSGTHVMEGSGQFLVTAVGLNSQNGIIMTLLGATADKEDSDNEDDEDNEDDKKKKKIPRSAKSKVSPENCSEPLENESSAEKRPKSAKNKLPPKKKEKKHKSVLQTKLSKLAIQIGYVGLVSASFTFIILILRMVIDEFGIKKNTWSNKYVKYILSYLINAITVIVVGVPEGLPLAVTLALAFAVRKMTKDNNLVRHIDACETMGNATTICSDKTGTLTTNRMTVVQCWIGGTLYEKIPQPNEIDVSIRELIYQSISVNSNYTSNVQPSSTPGELPKQIGNKTECGLLGFVNDTGGSYDEVRKNYPNDSFLKVYTFNSARKMMSTAIKTKDQTVRLHSKGASEMVLGKCSNYLDKNGSLAALSQDKINDMIKNVVEKMASNGLRTICVAYRDFNSEPDWEDETNILCNLTCICLVGIEDPVRPEVPSAVAACQSSGVVVRMVTGDNVNTATSIAIKCGIIKPGDDFLILESKDFNKRIRDGNGEVQQELLDNVWPKLRVLARSSPQDKYILVNGIVLSTATENQEVVAVTGDGTNDGPALKRADVGFAMGIQGTDVAKEAADIILTDDNFSSIVKAMMWGRNVYDAIAKFLQFQLTVNMVAGLFSVICAAAIQTVPLKAVQMLWVNLVMDTLASLALATEPPTDSLLKRKPYGRTKPMVSITMWKSMIGQSIYQLSILFGLIFGIESWMNVDSVIKYNDYNRLKDPSVHFTVVFNVFVIMTLFNEINGRKIHGERNVFDGIHNNLTFIIIWFICLGGQILIVNVGGVVFSVERIDWDHWMWSFFLGAGCLLWNQLIVCVPDSFVEKVFTIILSPCNRYKTNKESADQIKLSKSDSELTDKLNEPVQNSQIIKIPNQKLRQLWIGTMNRIQSQLLIIRMFKKRD